MTPPQITVDFFGNCSLHCTTETIEREAGPASPGYKTPRRTSTGLTSVPPTSRQSKMKKQFSEALFNRQRDCQTCAGEQQVTTPKSARVEVEAHSKRARIIALQAILLGDSNQLLANFLRDEGQSSKRAPPPDRGCIEPRWSHVRAGSEYMARYWRRGEGL